MGILILVGILVALAVIALFVGAGRAWELSSGDRVDDYVGEQMVRNRAAAQRTARLSRSAHDLVQGFDKILRSVGALDAVAYALQRAGIKLTVSEYLGIWLLCAAGAGGLAYLISRNVIAAILAAAVGGLLPHLYVRLREANRLIAFNNQLGNVLMQMSGSMRAGYGLLQAFDFVGHEMPPPAGPELAQVVRDVKLGSSLMDALDALGERVGSEDLLLIITAIRIHHEIGGNLTEILETVAETIRERVRIKGELRTLTAMQRFSGYVLGVLPIILFFVIMLINPQYESRLFTPGPTLCIPIGAIVLMIIGFLAIQRIVTIEV
jgi:tight adherence protein B